MAMIQDQQQTETRLKRLSSWMHPRASLESWRSSPSNSTSASTSSGSSLMKTVKSGTKTLGSKASKMVRKTTEGLKEQDFTSWEDSLKGLINSFQLARRSTPPEHKPEDKAVKTVQHWATWKGRSPLSPLPHVARRARSISEMIHGLGRLSMKGRTLADGDQIFKIEDDPELYMSPVAEDPPRLDIAGLGGSGLGRSNTFHVCMSDALKNVMGVGLLDQDGAHDDTPDQPEAVKEPSEVQNTEGSWVDARLSLGSPTSRISTLIVVPGGVLDTSQYQKCIFSGKDKEVISNIHGLAESIHARCYFNPIRKLLVLHPSWLPMDNTDDLLKSHGFLILCLENMARDFGLDEAAMWLNLRKLVTVRHPLEFYLIDDDWAYVSMDGTGPPDAQNKET